MTTKSVNSSAPEYMLAATSDSSVEALINKAVNGHIDGPPFVCPICSYSFEIRHRLVRHVVLHSDVKPYKCSFCEKSFKRKDYVKYHMQEYHKEEFVNEENNASASNQRSTEHTNTRAKEQKKNSPERNTHSTKIYKCRFCDDILDTRYQLRHHENEHMGLNTEPASNESTAKNHNVKTELLENNPAPAKSKRYYCEFCPVSYSRRCDLQKHVQKKHTDMSAETSTTVTNSSLRKSTEQDEKADSHYKSENIEDVSPKAPPCCNEISDLSNASFQCQTCNKVFVTEDARKVHETIHANQQRFQCSKCIKSYSRRDSLRKHIRNKHNGQGKVIVIDSVGPSQESFDIKKIVFDSNFENFTVTFDFNTGCISHVSPLNGSLDLSKLKSAFNAYNGAQAEQPLDFKDDTSYIRPAQNDNSDIWTRLADNFTIQPEEAPTPFVMSEGNGSTEINACNASDPYLDENPAKRLKLSECCSDNETHDCVKRNSETEECNEMPTDLSTNKHVASSTADSGLQRHDSGEESSSAKIVLSIFEKLGYLSNSHDADALHDKDEAHRNKDVSSVEASKHLTKVNQTSEALDNDNQVSSTSGNVASPSQQSDCSVTTIFEKLDKMNPYVENTNTIR